MFIKGDVRKLYSVRQSWDYIFCKLWNDAACKGRAVGWAVLDFWVWVSSSEFLEQGFDGISCVHWPLGMERVRKKGDRLSKKKMVRKINQAGFTEHYNVECMR